MTYFNASMPVFVHEEADVDFMALARLKSIEALRYDAPGEWGNLLGLDRAPEVRTQRAKIHLLARDDRPVQWSAALCERWMAAAPEQAGVLYIDGHVRVYNGSQTQLPRHDVARQRLCLRATTDYWVSAMDGQPFVVINQVVGPGLIQVIEEQIVPQLDERVPAQPDAEQLEADPRRHRLTLVFDREGYSPAFLRRMKDQRRACLTDHKYPGEDWSEDEFAPSQVRLANGEVVTMQLGERGTCLSNGLWVRELRKLTERGQQTAILCIDYCAEAAPLAAAMFALWSQENFFKYARGHYKLDRLIDYRTEVISDPLRVVNPDYRHLDGQVRSVTGKLTRRLANYAAMTLDGPIDRDTVDVRCAGTLGGWQLQAGGERCRGQEAGVGNAGCSTSTRSLLQSARTSAAEHGLDAGATCGTNRRRRGRRLVALAQSACVSGRRRNRDDGRHGRKPSEVPPSPRGRIG